MVLLVCFDLPRNSKDERKQATKFRQRLVELGFSMKQFSVYERIIHKTTSRDRVIEVLNAELPDNGCITMFVLSDEVYNNQIAILGHNVEKIENYVPKFIVF